MPIQTQTKTIHVEYFALLREQRGATKDSLKTSAKTAQDLYHELQQRYGLTLSADLLKVAINNRFCNWHEPLNDNDMVVFIPPVAGG